VSCSDPSAGALPGARRIGNSEEGGLQSIKVPDNRHPCRDLHAVTCVPARETDGHASLPSDDIPCSPMIVTMSPRASLPPVRRDTPERTVRGPRTGLR